MKVYELMAVLAQCNAGADAYFNNEELEVVNRVIQLDDGDIVISEEFPQVIDRVVSEAE